MLSTLFHAIVRCLAVIIKHAKTLIFILLVTKQNNMNMHVKQAILCCFRCEMAVLTVEKRHNVTRRWEATSSRYESQINEAITCEREKLLEKLEGEVMAYQNLLRIQKKYPGRLYIVPLISL